MYTKFTPKNFAVAVFAISNLIYCSVTAEKRSDKDLWTNTDIKSVYRLDRSSLPNKYKSFSLDLQSMKERLAKITSMNKGSNDNALLELPMPDGTFEQFRLTESVIMEEELAAKYPEIKVFTGVSVSDPSVIAKIDIGYLGFHAMIMTNGDRVFIDPVNIYTKENYIVYNRSDAKRLGTFSCGAQEDEEFRKETDQRLKNYRANNTNLAPVQLRTYRLALACTGEYASTKGGTKTGVMSGMVTSLNRINGVYETELAVHMNLVAKNDTLIFLNSSSDPYSNNDGGTMLGQNHSTCNARIGSGNYDIGHVFSTGGGGIASYASVCSSQRKGQGVTGLPSPAGDAFDIDYVAHEMGHQFGGSHTFNSQSGSCGGGNRNGSTAFEPGSGITIMAYAGICGSDDLDLHSIPYFHAGSIEEMTAFITGSGNSCAVKTTTANNPPIVDGGTDYTIPANTPFMLTGSAIDADGDGLTYSWEEMDLGPAGTVNAPSGDAPIFRTFAPVTTPSRMFPKLSDILSNTQTLGERKPTTTRTMNFRLTARDNRFMAGGTGRDNVLINVNATAGPFAITSNNTSQAVKAGDSITVTWSVANTTAAPVSCANVNILLSTDAGQSFPIILAANTPNDGSEKVLVPANTTTTGRIKVEAAGNVFFDINNSNITITNPTVGFIMTADVQGANVCENDTAKVVIDISAIAGFTDTVILSLLDTPAGATITFSNDTIIETGSATLNIITTGLPLGTYSLQINASVDSASEVKQVIGVSFGIRDTISDPVTLLFPYDGTQKMSGAATLSWNNINDAFGYRVQVSTDQTFAATDIDAIVTATSYTASPILSQNTLYYWRVCAVNNCNEGPFSAVRSFKTNGIPAPPTNMNVDSVDIDKIYLSWTDNADNEIAYKVERSTNGVTFAALITLEGNVTRYTNTGLAQNTKYYYRVRATNSTNNNSPYSNIDSGTTKIFVGISHANSFDGSLNVFPNPGDGLYNIELTGAETGAVKVLVMDELGRVVKEMNIEKSAEKINFALDLKEKAQGIYIVKIQLEGSQVVQRLIKY